MKYIEDAWSDKDRVRRDDRDSSRDTFFADMGGDKISDPFSWSPDGAGNLEHIAKMMEDALKYHQGDTQALESLKSTVMGLGLGAGGTGQSGALTYATQLIQMFNGSHFLDEVQKR
ncbi:hypothetical protein [Phyllobacterium myrsinacearum]|uniref:Uncharacterized protein n=1 Tax=Phyllobacterium myrsinacearum TaxID=28101 RepID=A0A839F0B2_9HYPH|nr:hypothetical protein [Phyllobacterium myrsinacearum]MBA8882047.1 hypothetical protein [Phyllobacterium myrsinacearum]